MEISCEFFNSQSLITDSSHYICKVTQVHRFAPNGRVLNIHGTHLENKTHLDVESIYFSDLQLVNFPRYLCKFFPNLKSISIVGCNVRNLTKYDLIGCDELEKLMMNGNKISALADDVFEYAQRIESLSFFDNQINFIGSKIFDNLKKLRYANFKMNPGIDVCCKEHGSGLISLEALKEVIKVKWHGLKVMNGNPKLVETFQFLETFVAASQAWRDGNNNNRV